MTGLIAGSNAVRTLGTRLAPLVFALLSANALTEVLVERRLISESFALEFAIFMGTWCACDALMNRRPLFTHGLNVPSTLALAAAVAVCNAWLHLYSFLAEAVCCAALYVALQLIMHRISAALSAKAGSRYG